MDAFSLLKYWRGSGASSTGATPAASVEVIESDEEGNGDDGPFFDMEFTVDGDDKVKNGENINKLNDIQESDDESSSDDCDCENEGEENEGELKFTLSSASSGESIDPNISLSPSDDLFFKGRLVPEAETDATTKPVSKSQKLRVLMLKLKKSTKLIATKTAENEENVVQVPEKEETKQSTKFFTVKFKVEEVPVLSMFTRDNSSKVANTKSNKENVKKSTLIEEDEEERVFSKDMVNKYLKKVKPLYFRVSKRYGEKLGFSGHLSLAGAMKTESGTPKVRELTQVKNQGDSTQVKNQGDSTQVRNVKSLKQGISFPGKLKAETGTPKVRNQGNSTQVRNVKSLKQGISFPGKLRVVRKQLGKSKSASSTVTAATDSPPVVMVAKRRDDSLLQQQDGIQSAILHCKRSFKASRDLEGKGGNENVSAADLTCSVDKAKGDMH